jgi:hypothetical protein
VTLRVAGVVVGPATESHEQFWPVTDHAKVTPLVLLLLATVMYWGAGAGPPIWDANVREAGVAVSVVVEVG